MSRFLARGGDIERNRVSTKATDREGIDAGPRAALALRLVRL